MEANRNGWHGMTIRDILEKVDLSNITTVEDDGKGKTRKEATSVITLSNYPKLKGERSVIQTANPTSAYLGPKLWNKNITISNLEFENEEEEEEEEPYSDVMNMEEFLAENNIKMDMIEERSPEPSESMEAYSPSAFFDSPQSPPSSCDIKPQTRPSIIIAPKRETAIKTDKEFLPRGENTFLYAESKRAKLEREKEERRRQMEAEVDFSPEDLALATIPGMDFDPKERAFDLDELRPQPIIKKRKKIFVPNESKDDKYWDKRGKNNVAARRSREARRLKENQIALRAAYLEKENRVLKKELDNSQFDNTKLATERNILKRKISQYEAFALH
eukprot:GFUD01036944.1.p1 GENE.GFUD01036944.1~~GFUD01036944.1.p1  ORF type:complete len:332 (+),score=106.87 GFUD01036944.1:50-1045(+)